MMRSRSVRLLFVAILTVLLGGMLPAAVAGQPWSDASVEVGAEAAGKSAASFFSAEEFEKTPVLSSIPAFKELPENLNERIAVWRQIARTLMKEAPDSMAAAGSCEAYAVVWLQRLAQEGYPLHYAQTSGMGDVILDGKSSKLDKIHVFVVDRGLCGREGDDPREIIICPTWTQFFEPGECLFKDSRELYLADGGKWNPADELTTLPPVFIGTRYNLVAAYEKFSSRLSS